jgi:hypothetical protein
MERTAEAPASTKLTHAAVKYEHPAMGTEHCSGCEHYIQATPPRCQHVKNPIRAEDWCIKYETKTL